LSKIGNYNYYRKILDTARVVQEYLKEGATISSVASVTGIPSTSVRRLLDDKEIIFEAFGINGSKAYNAVCSKLANNSSSNVIARVNNSKKGSGKTK